MQRGEMSTALAQQLHQLQVARATSDHRPRGKPSLVFTPQEAADLDAEVGRARVMKDAFSFIFRLCSCSWWWRADM